MTSTPTAWEIKRSSCQDSKCRKRHGNICELLRTKNIWVTDEGKNLAEYRPIAWLHRDLNLTMSHVVDNQMDTWGER